MYFIFNSRIQIQEELITHIFLPFFFLPNIFDLTIFGLNIFWSHKFSSWTQNLFGRSPMINFWSSKLFGPKFITKSFWTPKIFLSKFVWSKIFWTPNIFGSESFFGLQNSLGPKNLGTILNPKLFWTENYFRTQEFKIMIFWFPNFSNLIFWSKIDSSIPEV